MSKQNRFGTITALALALCLLAAPAWASLGFHLVNSSGGTIRAGCTGTSSSRDIANGQVAGFTCTGTLALQLTEANARAYTIADDDCASDEYHTITATAGTAAGTLSFAEGCETGASTATQ